MKVAIIKLINWFSFIIFDDCSFFLDFTKHVVIVKMFTCSCNEKLQFMQPNIVKVYSVSTQFFANTLNHVYSEVDLLDT